MLIKTKALVLSSLKYGDTSKIVKFYTQEHGIKSFIAKGIYSKKNKTNAFFHPLNAVELVYEDRNQSSLLYFKEIRQDVYYQSLYNSPQKVTIVLFLAEVLNSVLNEEENNSSLFEYLSNALQIFDQRKINFADFHLWFLFNLTQFLGFYPHLNSNQNYFDLREGISTNSKPADIFISKDELLLFEKLSVLEFNEDKLIIFNKIQRNSVLETLLRYYELHISNFRRPKSLDVLRVVFD